MDYFSSSLTLDHCIFTTSQAPATKKNKVSSRRTNDAPLKTFVPSIKSPQAAGPVYLMFAWQAVLVVALNSNVGFTFEHCPIKLKTICYLFPLSRHVFSLLRYVILALFVSLDAETCGVALNEYLS